MQALRARVSQGRILLNEPTDLPEGTELELVRIDELHAKERAAFVSAVREGLADADAGRVLSDEEARRRLESKFGPLAT